MSDGGRAGERARRNIGDCFEKRATGRLRVEMSAIEETDGKRTFGAIPPGRKAGRVDDGVFLPAKNCERSGNPGTGCNLVPLGETEIGPHRRQHQIEQPLGLQCVRRQEAQPGNRGQQLFIGGRRKMRRARGQAPARHSRTAKRAGAAALVLRGPAPPRTRSARRRCGQKGETEDRERA